jgi:putative PIN family toxin of toxin-antitoxin system
VGAEQEILMRVVLDTNTLISALLFSGTAARLIPLWQSGRITPLISQAILAEYYRVLSYPKFGLAMHEIRALIDEEVLPFTEVVAAVRRVPSTCRDADDQKFLDCAVAGHAQHLITGDADLPTLTPFHRVLIRTPAEFLQSLEA